MLGLSAVLKFSQDRGERYKMVKEADSRVDLPVRQNTPHLLPLGLESPYTKKGLWENP